MEDSVVELLEKAFQFSSGTKDFALFSRKYINITRANQMVKLNLFFNKTNKNVSECLQILENHGELLQTEGINLIQILIDLLLEDLSAEERRKVTSWVINNFQRLKKKPESLLSLLKAESGFFSQNISKIKFKKNDIPLKFELLQTGKRISNLIPALLNSVNDHKLQLEFLKTVIEHFPWKLSCVIETLPLDLDLTMNLFIQKQLEIPQIGILSKRGAFEQGVELILKILKGYTSTRELTKNSKEKMHLAVLEFCFLLEQLVENTFKSQNLVLFQESFNEVLEITQSPELREDFRELAHDMLMLAFQDAFEAFKQRVFSMNQMQ